MFFKTQTRKNPDTGELSIYYRLVESYRNILGEVRQRNIMSVGFMDDICPKELWAIADGLNALNENKIILYDLTNTYFEGEKRNSKKAKRGRSKEKRSDCPLLVLALVVNTAGFPKYSAIYEGNRGDSTTLCDMIDKLRLSTSSYSQKGIVVIDAGIATEDNLAAIVAKGYDYVCVNRTTFNTSHILEQKDSTYVEDNKGRKTELSEIKKDGQKDTEYYLRVKSPGKELKERSMNKQFVERFEEGLSVIVKGINSKGGTKSYDKVNQRIGRLKAKYPSVHRFYKINIEKNDKDICLSMNWEQVSPVVNEADENHGIYYIRTTLTGHGEDVIWDIYNCIREIESSFRCLKTDLDLRPVYHKSDKASEAHIHLALLAYSVVNTIRYHLKLSGLNYGWTEIRRQMGTHKIVTTTMLNNKGEYIGIRTCSKPNNKVKAIYQALKMKEAPFTRKKFVVLKSESEKKLNHHYQENTG